VVAAVFTSIGLTGFLHVLYLPVGPVEVVFSFVCIATLLALQLTWYAQDSPRLHDRRGHLVLAAQAGLVYLPLLVFGGAWAGVPGFLAGSVLLVFRPLVAWTAFCLVVGSVGLTQPLFGGNLADVVYATVGTVTTGLVVYGMSRLTTLITEVQASRAELARMAVLRERLRFARDLHDLLGYSLSAITLKVELTHRLMERAPKEASDQLLELLEISRLAVADTRTVASGYRELSLEEECRSVGSVLAAADISLRVDSDDLLDLPVGVSTVLATVLREGVTNLLRHSKAKHCVVEVRLDGDHASIDVVNDGPQQEDDDEERESCDSGGLHNLSVRAAEIGGAVSVTHTPGEFRLRAEVPLRTAHRAGWSQPARLARDADRVDPVARGQLADDRGQVVPDRADREEQP
jgi:two-component system sensor histidine kinase DesK